MDESKTAGCCNASLINSHARYNSNNWVYYIKSNVGSVKNTTRQEIFQNPRTRLRVQDIFNVIVQPYSSHE